MLHARSHRRLPRCQCVGGDRPSLVRTRLTHSICIGITRTRNPDVINAGSIVVDVGGEYDAARNRFDHHQRGFAETFSPDYKTKLSSAGLIYKCASIFRGIPACSHDHP